MIERYKEHIFQMEKCSFLLDIIRAHVSVIMTTDANSGSMLDACIILGGVSPQYCDFILKMRKQFPNHDLEMLSQEIYDRIFSLDYKSTAKFQAFFEDSLKEWYRVRAKEKQLRTGMINKDETVANFKHAYYTRFNTDIEIIELQQDKQQETKVEEDEDDTKEMIRALNERVAQDEIICKMFREGAIPEEVALEYVGGDLDHDSFMKLVSLYTDEGKEPETEQKTEEAPFDFFEYHKKETEAKMICKMYREGIIDEAVALEYLDEPEWSHDTLMRVVDYFAEKEKGDELDE